MKTNYPSVWTEVFDAYSDCNEISSVKRNLNFQSSHSFDPHTAYVVMWDALGGVETYDKENPAEEPGYNEFNPDLLNKLNDYGKDVTLHLAREVSVCVYVQGIPKDFDLKVIYDEMLADEVDWDGEFLRIWWD